MDPILIVDDVPEFVAELKAQLTDAGFNAVGRVSPLRAIKDVRRGGYSLLITTLMMKELGGFDVIRQVRNGGSSIPILMITGYGSDEAAIEATRIGATDYMNKPVMPAELVARVRRIVHAAAAPTAVSKQVDELVSNDPAMQSVLELVNTVAHSSSRVLILGETGTGKQLIAQAIHHQSPRRNEPFVALNCAAVPDTLLDSELFGHEKGAFTGADRRRIGRIEEAGDGTIFLDEIGEMSYATQTKLLKVLTDGQFSRAGGEDTLTCRARVITATNRDLGKEAAEGRFRMDLFYRLHVVTIALPPLRKRQGDVTLLANYFLNQFSQDGIDRRFSPDALTVLQRYSWPGNVRELENLVERVAVLSRGPIIGIDALPERVVQQSMGSTASAIKFSARTTRPKSSSSASTSAACSPRRPATWLRRRVSPTWTGRSFSEWSNDWAWTPSTPARWPPRRGDQRLWLSIPPIAAGLWTTQHGC